MGERRRVKEEVAKMRKSVTKRPLGRGSQPYFLLLFSCCLFLLEALMCGVQFRFYIICMQIVSFFKFLVT